MACCKSRKDRHATLSTTHGGYYQSKQFACFWLKHFCKLAEPRLRKIPLHFKLFLKVSRQLDGKTRIALPFSHSFIKRIIIDIGLQKTILRISRFPSQLSPSRRNRSRLCFCAPVCRNLILQTFRFLSVDRSPGQPEKCT